jgi:large subunit ribosomal protein L11
MPEVKTQLNLQLPAGEATPGPPLGPTLGQHGVDIQRFVSQFNEETQDQKGALLPVILTIYQDRSFDFETKTPLASYLIKEAAGVETASGEPNLNKVGQITESQVREIAKKKMNDLNAYDLDQAKKIIKGTARSMGIEIEA